MSASVKRGRTIVLLIIFFCLTVESFTSLLWASTDAKGAALMRFLPCLALAYFLYEGRRWVRWLTAVLLGLLGLLLVGVWVFLNGPHAFPLWVSMALSAISLAMAGALLISPSVQEFLRLQRIPRQAPVQVPEAAVDSADPLSAPAGPPPLPGTPASPAHPAAKGKPWLYEFSCALLLASIPPAVYGLTRCSDSEAAGYLTGQYTGAGLVALLVGWLAWRFGYARRAGAGLLWFSLVFAAASYSVTLEKASPQSDPKAVQEAMLDIMNSVAKGEDVRRVAIDEKRCGKMLPAVRALQGACIEIQDEGARFTREYEKCGLDDLLGCSVVDDVERIRDARERARKGIALLERYGRSLTQILHSLPEKACAAGLPRSLEDGFRKGVNQGIGRQSWTISSVIKNRVDILVETDATLEFLEGRQGGYRLEDDRLVFDADENAEVYGAHLKKISDFEAKLRRVVDDIQKNAAELPARLRKDMSNER